MAEHWQTLIAVDFDKWASTTYAANFPRVDVRCASVADLLDSLPAADVVVGGPPCQPHSLAGKRQASADARDCGPDFVAAVARIKPRMFLMENVPGLLSSEGGAYAQRLFAALEAAGYVVDYRVLDAVNYGVPQFRSRVWFWGIRRDLYAAGIRHRWPQPTHQWPPVDGPTLFSASLLPGVTVGQALGLDGELHHKRGKGFCERGGQRRDTPTTEPSPNINSAFALGGGGGLFIQSHRGPEWEKLAAEHTVDEPSPTVQAGSRSGGGDGIYLQYDHGIADPSAPCPTLKAGANIDGGGKQGGGCPPLIVIQDVRDIDKGQNGQGHRPDSPAYTVDGMATQGVGVRVWGGGRNHPADENGEYRRDKRGITDEPSTTIAGFNGATTPTMRVQILDRQNNTLHSADEPIGTIRAGEHKGGKAAHFIALRAERGEGMNDRHGQRPDSPVTAPSPTARSSSQGSGCRLSIVTDAEPYRWSDEMLAKHPPASPASPAPTVQAKWFKGGAEGLLALNATWKRKGELWVRRLTPLECARLQSVPDSFVWPEGLSKTNAYRVIGNGVACGMAAAMSRSLATADPDSRTVIDLFCGGGLGAVGWHQRYWQYEPTNAGKEVARAH